MRISDWSSDVCSSDLLGDQVQSADDAPELALKAQVAHPAGDFIGQQQRPTLGITSVGQHPCGDFDVASGIERSEEHASELQSLMRISYAVFCLKKKIQLQLILNAPHQHNFINTITLHHSAAMKQLID